MQFPTFYNNLGSNALGIAAAALYISSAAMLYRMVITSKGHTSQGESGTATRRRIAWLIAIAAAVLHAVTLVGSTFQTNGINLAFFNSLSVTAWVTVAITLLLNIGRPVINLGLILFPLAALILFLAAVFTKSSIPAVASETQWHVLISVIAYALLTIAAGQSILVSLQDRRLRSHRPGGFLQSLPPLKVMETVLFQMLVASFLLLSLALASGYIFVDDLFAQRLVHKTVLSLLAWLLLAILLLGQLRWGWRGQKAAGMTLGAYIALLLGYFGSKFVKELILD